MKNCLHEIVTGNESNQMKQKYWLGPLQAAPSQSKRSLHYKKFLLCVWWDNEGILYTEFIPERQSIKTTKYCE